MVGPGMLEIRPAYGLEIEEGPFVLEDSHWLFVEMEFFSTHFGMNDSIRFQFVTFIL